MAPSATSRVHAIITGRVQAVAYRWSCSAQARKLGLAGWVRNLADGRVELLAEGDRTKLDALVAWCQQGPPAARVSKVVTDWDSGQNEFTEFNIR